MPYKCNPLNPGVIIAVVISVLVGAGVIGGANGSETTGRFVVDVENTVSDGNSPDLVIIPGLTSSPAAFKTAITAPPPARTHWITLAGFAGIPAPQEMENFTAPAADALTEYIKSNQLRDVRLVGHSMGGVISLMIAAEEQESIDSVLIVDSVPFLAGLMQPGATPGMMAPRKQFMQAQFAAMSDEQFYAVLRQGLPVQATSAESQALVWADIERSDRNAIALATSEIFTTDYSALLPRVKAKVTVLVPHNRFQGATPDELKASYAAQYQGLKNVEIIIIEDSRHFIMLDQPQAFAAALNTLLEESR